MVNSDDLKLIEDRIGRKPNSIEKGLFEQLWSEHCAYRSSRGFLKDLPVKGDNVLVDPGDDAGVIDVGGEKIALGIESHNHPSYVDPYNGAATGVGGIVRDILSMGARPIALFDCLYFGEFEQEETRYLFEGVVEGISDYGNSIGVPTVGGQVFFDEGYEGNPLVNVACIGRVEGDILTGGLKEEGNKLILVGAATGRDGLGGASFASEELEEDAEIEDRSSVQIGDPYTEKLLIDATLEIKEHIEAARDLGAAGLGGASCEMAADGGLGANIYLDKVHLREDLDPLEILLSESQERMLFEAREEEIKYIEEKAEKYDLESSVIGEVTSNGKYTALFEGETIVNLPAKFVAEGAPLNKLEVKKTNRNLEQKAKIEDRNDILDILSFPNNASKKWIYRQYDHEVGTKTLVGPGDDVAVLDIFDEILERKEGKALMTSSGCNPARVYKDPYKGGKEAVLENIINIAVKGGRPIAMVNCLNFGSPENPEIYWELKKTIKGMGDAADDFSIPIIGGNVSLYNETHIQNTEKRGAIKPTPTVVVVGKGPIDPPTIELNKKGDILLIDIKEPRKKDIENLSRTIKDPSVSASHDISKGGLIVSLAEMSKKLGATIDIDRTEKLFNETPGKAIIVTDKPEKIERKINPLKTEKIGKTKKSGLEIKTPNKTINIDHDKIKESLKYIEKSMT